MKKGIFILAIIWWIFMLPAKAQSFASQESWYDGSIHLKNGETKKGRVYYDRENELVLVKETEAIKTYNVRQVESFELVDFAMSTFRWFCALPFEEKGRKKDRFFEVLADAGNLALLSREGWVPSRQPMGVYAAGWETGMEKGDIYYLLNKTTIMITPCPETAKPLLEQMGSYKEAVGRFIHEHKLNPGSRKDLIKIFYYYQSLQEKNDLTQAL